jgi:hypothetical protein
MVWFEEVMNVREKREFIPLTSINVSPCAVSRIKIAEAVIIVCCDSLLSHIS